MKICSRCRLEKDYNEFYKMDKSKDGYLYSCKKCTNDYKNAWRDKKKGKIVNYELQGRRIGEGKGYIDKNGYVVLNKKAHPNAWNKVGTMMQHTWVMSQHLGRPLSKSETVHHKNGIRHDNRIENLELWDRRHGPGQRVVDKIEWSIAFLKEYGYKVTKEEM